ncbi:M56 family metallopeptidase [Formosa sp. PL04]|uniref:M56 family metallopeptidase n=1 Tax=Formosa sp. PL04 TaxID=3081755 RepID=UPI002981497F|nr:M56 family metallopeptidase [Formosa sp. PL04]MDW5287647.1 M56 family metallopeptidase [Formosa sp. PL04]
MDYFLKASAIICIFYVIYALLLQKETFFNTNRWFLLSGLILAAFLPFLVIPIYVNEVPLTLNFNDIVTVKSTETASRYTWLDLGILIYTLGIVFFSIRFVIELLSLKSFITVQNTTLENSYKISETKDDIPPFSFFKRIVYNPSQFTEIELTHILNHEKIHASEYHSIDILLSKLATIVFWCNPIIWLYQKALIQNLEFIADSKSITINSSTKTYQKVLLKTSVSSHQMTLTTNFYNSLIKKRILMLNTSKSKTIHAIKYAIIAPALLIFMMSFNTKTVYKSEKQTHSMLLNSESEISVIITKDDSDAQLDALVKTFAIQKVTLKIKNVKRNVSNEITAISINAKSERSALKHDIDSDNPIAPIKISFNNNTQLLNVGESQPSSDIVFTSTKNASKTNPNNKNAFVVNTTDGSSITIKKLSEDITDQNVMFISDDLKTSQIEVVGYAEDINNENTIQTSETSETSTVRYRNNSNETPLIFVNGKETSQEDMEKIDPDTIAKINVLKGEHAIAKYGDKAKDGVIEITLK